MSEQPTVSVIIPHFNDLVNLDICLAALRAQTYPAGRLQIIVADNASPQGLDAVQAAAGDRAQVVLVEERGAGPARNGGVAKATGEVLAFIDSDCVADPRWIEEGVAALSRFDFVGGQVTVLVSDEQRMTPVEAWERVFAFDFKTYIEKKGFTGSGNLFCPRSLFETVAGFRAGISEDYEWSKRAQSCGFKLGYAPKAIVGHPARRNWEELTRKWRRLNIETYGLSAGRPGRRLRWFLRSLLLPLSAVAHTPKVLTNPGLHTFGQRLGALRVLYAIRLWRVVDSWAVLGRDIQQVREGRPGVESLGADAGAAGRS
ncbi:glycosyltransferase [Phenylobacterium sp.]|uniref:glycosyltransferase n=1 Tax=Phenylobacterium sp. TaxID=1871053 RepID=UPI002BB19FFD|nr:glycosyltransferase [Phenylobacterium sp.]HLZ75554.1 glycosyltransferase [Phenylobacterium sp.]